MMWLSCPAALLGAAAFTTYEFWKVNPTAGKMLLPYLAFLGYANALNYSVWKKNPEVRGWRCAVRQCHWDKTIWQQYGYSSIINCMCCNSL